MKDKLQVGDILHCRGKRLLSRMIMRVSRSQWSHTAIVVESWGQLFIIDAQQNGVNARPYKEWVKQYGYDVEIARPINPVHVEEFCKKAFGKIGHTRYDIASLFWHQPLYILTGKWRGRTQDNALKKMYCSEFVGWMYELPNWWTLSPKQVYEITEDPKFGFETITVK